MVLAARQGTLLYEGAPVCQRFGNEHFYYVSCAMNCIFDCAYCYLKGMYPSANIVVFVNLEDIFAEVERVLENHPLYLCVSYDTDLCAFAAKHAQLTIEIRTKCANKAFVQSIVPMPNVIYAYTISPQAVIDAFEHHTASLSDRLFCAAALMRAGCPVRLCFDPMISLPGWKTHWNISYFTGLFEKYAKTSQRLSRDLVSFSEGGRLLPLSSPLNGRDGKFFDCTDRRKN